MPAELAIDGGYPVRRIGTWPRWPVSGSRGLAYAQEAVRGPRLSVRAQWTPGKTFDDRLSAKFAAYHGCQYAVPVNSGTTAIEIALEALGVGSGDEVIMPALTWVATALAALRLNARPVFVDVDPIAFTIDPKAIVNAITPRTAAIVPVHWHCAVAPMEVIEELGARYGLAVVEDCAQAHGGRYRGRMVGSWGDAGAFSFHNDKLISAGEGGILTTNNAKCCEDAQALRLDGFDWQEGPQPFIDGPYAQKQGGRIMGTSLALSEPCSALALAGLERLEELSVLRESNGERLGTALSSCEGFAALPRVPGTDIRPFYEFAVCLSPESPLEDAGIEAVCKALAAELGFPVYPEIHALTENPLYRPNSRARYAGNVAHLEDLLSGRFDVPIARQASRRLLLFLHPPLSGTDKDIDDIATAFSKVSYHARRLVEMQRNQDPRLVAPLAYWST